VLVVEVSRHGAREPHYIYPWAAGANFEHPEELTRHGEEQHFELGQFVRKHYEDFLPATYNPFDIYTQTTYHNRTFVSALY